MRRLIACLTLTSALVLAGCGDDGKPKVAVEGRLKLGDGKVPPAGTRLLFNPVEGRMGTASGTTDASGGFTLTHASGSAGAETGRYTVQLLPPPGDEKEFYKLIPKEAADGALSAEVKEGMGLLELTVRPSIHRRK